ncbi:MAG: permease [Okeania sp. SIO3H1]|nr:permease [Okeania sp. SIO3H1]
MTTNDIPLATDTVVGTFDQQTFLRQTYGHLVGAIAAFIVTEYLLFVTGVAAALIPIMTSNWLWVIGGFMVLGYLTSYFANKNSSPSMQYVELSVTVLLQAVIFLPLMAFAVFYSDTSVLTNAAMITLGTFAVMTAIVAYSGRDFSFLGPAIAVVGIAALVAIVGAVLFNVTLGFYFAVGMAVFAAVTVLYETSNVLHRYGPGQHVAAATGLFASVALLFYYVLMALISRR